jgi:fused signal recognition particle receptor
MVLIIVLIVAGVVLLASAGLVVATRRRSVEPRAPVAPPPVRIEEAPSLEAREEPPLVEEEAAAPVVEEAPVPAEEDLVEAPPRFRDRLGRARSLLSGYMSSVRSRDRIDDTTWEELEEALILADVGATVTAGLLDDLRARVKQDGIEGPVELIEALKAELTSRLVGDRDLNFSPDGMNVWLFVGVNGVGKTTTIGKIGMRQSRAGHRVVMAAGDTFRAAAADQLQMWSEQVGASIIRGNEGGDPGAVVFDAVQHAAARGADLVLADTAGRLHTKSNLMEELKKVRRVAERPPGVVSEVLLVIDATTGQNGLTQARQFAAAAGVTGVVLTKLDGTAKGGIVVAIRTELGLPIKLVGLGEGPEDLVDFDAGEFVDALLGSDD